MRILAIDPGPDESAWVLFEGSKVLLHSKDTNDLLVRRIYATPDDRWPGDFFGVDVAVIEMIASYGMAVGKEVFETCVWIGRFMEAIEHNIITTTSRVERIFRKDVKLTLCGSVRASDANIRADLIDRWGGKEVAIGTKKNPGPLYGITGDVWAALAIAKAYSLEHVEIKKGRIEEHA